MIIGSRIGGLNWLFKLATAIREASVSNEVTMRRERAGKMWLTWAKFFYLLSESQQCLQSINQEHQYERLIQKWTSRRIQNNKVFLPLEARRKTVIRQIIVFILRFSEMSAFLKHMYVSCISWINIFYIKGLLLPISNIISEK